MRKNKMMRFASGLLVAVLLTTSIISGTFAKYTSSASGSDTATVAKWSFMAMGKDIAVKGSNTNLSFDLFKTIKDTGNTDDEKDVAAGKKIAPGTSGSFAFDVKNTSEVTAKYTIKLTEANASNVPLQYSLDGKTWKDSIAELDMEDLTDHRLEMGSDKVTHTVYWRWAYEGTEQGAHSGQTDIKDTDLGIDAQNTAPTVTIKADITATQVD